MLCTRHGYSAKDLYRVFGQANRVRSFKIAEQRLRACVPGNADEGCLHLVEPAPSLEELRVFLNASLDQLEIDLSKAAFRSNAGVSTPGLQGDPFPGYPAFFPLDRGQITISEVAMPAMR